MPAAAPLNPTIGIAVPALKVGLQLRSLRQPLKQALITAARLGAQGVEIDARTELTPKDLSQTALRQMRKLLDDLGLRVCAVEFRTRRGYDDQRELDRRIQATKEAMQMAYALGANVVINHVGMIPEKPEGPRWQTLVEALRDLGHFAERNGAFLAANTGMESAADLKRLVDALPEGALAVNLDPGKLVMNGHVPLDVVQQLGPRILHVHARDAVRDRSQGSSSEVDLGRGSVELPEVLAALEEQGYRGYVTVAREQSPDPLGDCGRAIQYLRSL